MVNGEDSVHARPQGDLETRQDKTYAAGGFDDPAGGIQERRYAEFCDAIALADGNQISTYWSPAAEKMFGWRADEIVGRPISGMVQAEYPGCPREQAFAHMRQDGCFQGEAVLRHKNGLPVCVNIHSVVLPGEGGMPAGFFVLFRDIAGCRKQEDSPNTEPERDDALVMSDSDQIFTYWNTAAEKMFGWRADEVLGKPLAGLLGTEYPGCGREQAFVQINEIGCFQGEALLRHKDGSPVYANVYAGVRRGEDDRVVGSFTIFREITGRRKIDRSLSDFEKEYMDITDSATTGTFVHDLQKGEAFYSAAWKKSLGAEDMSPAELAGLPERLLHPDDYSRILDSYRKGVAARAAKIGIEARIRTVDLGYRWSRGQVRILYGETGEPLKLIGMQTDVTEQKSLTESLRFHADVLAGVHDGVAAIGQDNRIYYWNHMAEKLSGIPAQDILGMSTEYVLSLALIDYEDMERIRQCLRTGGVFTGEVRVRSKDGALIWGDAHVKPTSGEGGFCGIVATFRDISERKQAEDQLAFQAHLLACANEGILFSDRDHAVTYWNRAAEKQFGWTAEEATGVNVCKLLQMQIPGGDIEETFQRFLKEGDWSGELTVRGKEGSQIWIELYARMLQDEQGGFLGIVISSRDITARKYGEAQSERRNAVLGIINRMYQEYVACDTMEQLGNVCLQETEKSTGSLMSFIGEINEDGMFHDIALNEADWNKCMPNGQPGHRDYPYIFPVRGLYGVALRSGETLLTNDPAGHPESRGLPEGHTPLESFLAVPYLQSGRVCGLLAVANRPGGYGEDERETLEALTPTVISILMRKRAEIALQESESLYRTLFENTDDAFMLLEPVFGPNDREKVLDVRFVRVSRKFKRQTGLTAAYVAGKTLLTLFPDIEPYWISGYGQAAHSRVPVHYQNYHGGTKRWYDMFCFPYGKGLTGVLFRDITAKKRTEAELLRAREELAQRAVDKYQSLFQSIDEGFCILQVEMGSDSRTDYRILEANAQYHVHTGKPPELMGLSMRAAVPEIDEYWYDLFGQVAWTGNPERRTSLYATPGKRWLDVYAFPAGEPGSGLVAALFRDVTERKRSEDILRENERLYRTVFENSQDGFALVEILYDEAGKPAGSRLLKINQAFEKMYGQKAEHIAGKSGRKMGYAVDPEILSMQDDCLRTGKTAHYEEYSKALDRWFDIYVFPYGQTTLGQLFRDITLRKQNEEMLHQSELLYRKLFDNTEEGFMLCQPVKGEGGKCVDFIALSVNRGWELQTGLRAEDGVLEQPLSLFFENEMRWFRPLRQVLKTGKSVSFEEYNNYTEKWYDVRAFLYNEEVVGVLLRNITDRKRAEEALRESQKKALRLVHELEEANKNKNEFLNMLSHELRNPLASISAGIQLLDLTQNEEHARRAKDVIGRQMHQLCRLTDDLLDLTRISNNKIRLIKEQVELNSLATLAAEDYRALFDQKGVTLKTETETAPVLLEADPARLRQAIGNLLHNAMKFTDRGGEVLLQVSLEGMEAVLTVWDTGLGIEADLLPRLFEPFRQGDAALDRLHGGLGLGLSITRGIAELHGGSVSAHSAGLKRGSRFVIRLPVGLPVSAVGEGADTMAAEPLNILLIEDNPDQAEILCLALRELGHRVEYATDGVSGLRAALSQLPDVVLCDIGLPCMDGYSVARAIRCEPALSQTVLVALTGFVSDKYKKQAQEAGFSLHTCKPVDMDSLKRLLAGIRRRPRQKRA